MEMHQLRYMVAVGRTGNFSRAAEQCHVAQPSVSQQIQKLEEELGERLFDRLKREVRLTSAGERFLRRAVRILEEVDAARRDLTEAKELASGTLTIGVLPTIAPYLLPAVVAQFTESFPGVEVVIQEDTTARLIKLLLAYEIEIALASVPLEDARIETQELFTEELLLALPPGHPLGRRRSIEIEDLERERFIVMKEGHCLGDQVLQFCARRDLQASVTFRSAQLETIQSMVRAGLGISFIPAMAASVGGSVAEGYRSLKGPRPERKIVAAWPHQRPPGRAAREFLGRIPETGAKARSVTGESTRPFAKRRSRVTIGPPR
jgi:LysR family hydrogen peroxide-inducible transcriptional activator